MFFQRTNLYLPANLSLKNQYYLPPLRLRIVVRCFFARLPAISCSDSWVPETQITKNLFLGTIPERRHDADRLRLYVLLASVSAARRQGWLAAFLGETIFRFTAKAELKILPP